MLHLMQICRVVTNTLQTLMWPITFNIRILAKRTKTLMELTCPYLNNFHEVYFSYQIDNAKWTLCLLYYPRCHLRHWPPRSEGRSGSFRTALLDSSETLAPRRSPSSWIPSLGDSLTTLSARNHLDQECLSTKTLHTPSCCYGNTPHTFH